MDWPPRRGAFFAITLPLIMPAVIAGFDRRFSQFLHDLVIASFTTAPRRSADSHLFRSATWRETGDQCGVRTIVRVIAVAVIAASLIGKSRDRGRALLTHHVRPEAGPIMTTTQPQREGRLGERAGQTIDCVLHGVARLSVLGRQVLLQAISEMQLSGCRRIDGLSHCPRTVKGQFERRISVRGRDWPCRRDRARVPISRSSRSGQAARSDPPAQRLHRRAAGHSQSILKLSNWGCGHCGNRHYRTMDRVAGDASSAVRCSSRSACLLGGNLNVPFRLPASS